MSLILEALRKLEKEKQAPERGFLVVAASAWPATKRRVGPAAIVIATLAVVGIGSAAWFWPRGSPRRDVGHGGAPVPAVQAPAATAPPSTLLPAPVPTTPPALASQARSAPAPTPSLLPRASVAPRPTPQPSPPALVLEAISQRDGRPIALVSDHLVHEGDAFDGVTIVRIGEAEVEVEWQGKRQILRF
jgi:hypothetical protein